jgi:hypothetical protein
LKSITVITDALLSFESVRPDNSLRCEAQP